MKRRILVSISLLAFLLVVGSLPVAASDGWTYVYGPADPETFVAGRTVTPDPEGGSIVAGQYIGDPGFGSTPVDGFDVFVMALNPDGVQKWVTTMDVDAMDGDGGDDPSNTYPYRVYGGESMPLAVDDGGTVWMSTRGPRPVFYVLDEVTGDLEGTYDAQAFTHGFGYLASGLYARPGGGVYALTFGSSSNACPGDQMCVIAIGGPPGDVDTEWILPFSDPAGVLGGVVLPDGDLILAADVSGEFSFQTVSQSVFRIDAAGSVDWQVLNRGRCSGVGINERLHAWVNGNEFVVPSAPVDTQWCTGWSDAWDWAYDATGLRPSEMARYDVTSGRLLGTYDLPQTASISVCLAAEDEGVWPEGTFDATETYHLDVALAECHRGVVRLIPEAGQGVDATAVGLLYPQAGNFPEEDSFPVVGKYIFDGEGFTLVEIRRLADSDIYAESAHIDAAGGTWITGQADGDLVVDGSSVTQGASLAAGEPGTRLLVAFNPVPLSGTFCDDDGSIFEGDIESIARAGITRGCNPPANTRYCPDSDVSRKQMAAFMVRALGLTVNTHPGFEDVPSDSVFADDIGKLATAGITKGCNPPANTRYCPDSKVSRSQMAAFMVRALGLTENTHGGFEDVPPSSVYTADIGKLATAGITKGCNPPANTRYCPDDPVGRDQMAAFMRRAGWGA